MPSLFGRSGTGHKKDKHVSSTLPAKHATATARRPPRRADGVGEFGAIASGSRIHTFPARPSRPLTPPGSPTSPPPAPPPKYTFLPTRLPHATGSDNSIDSFKYSSEEVTGLRPYGFLGGIGSKVVLGLVDVGRVIEGVGRELNRRGLTTPMLFSNQALEGNQTRSKMLIQAYLDSISGNGRPGRSRSETFAQDLKYASEHELAWLLRWGLSRITRKSESSREEMHGVLDWEAYEDWRGRERAAAYPTDAYPYLSSLLPSDAYTLILSPLLHLLSRFAAHSHLSGLTPHALASLFAPLLFDIPSSSTAMHAHATFVRAASATEHLLLAYVRWSGSSRRLGTADLPGRLKEWVAGYPAMLASDADLARGAPRKGARVVRCERATRTVRAYTRDLVVGAESWSAEVQWEAFDRIKWKSKRSDGRPKYSAAYRRRMGVKETPPPPPADSSEFGGRRSYGVAMLDGQGQMMREAGTEDGEGRWGSLAGKEWSMFEEGGFDAPIVPGGEDMKTKLQFDLTESAKHSITERRRTMDWTEFASPAGGFNRTDPLLEVSLSFSAPLNTSIAEWPKEREDLRRRLVKAQKDATPFNHDTTPRVGADASPEKGQDNAGRVYVEEAFVDCWADLMMGCGWADREELTFREANWAFVEYKARPRKPEDVHPRDDPRTTDLYFLFEERVPLDYQLALVDPNQKNTFGLFSPKKKRIIQRAKSGVADTDFDRMLLHRSATKRITLSKPDQSATVWHLIPPQKSPIEAEAPRPRRRSAANEKPVRQRDSVEEAKMVDTKNLFFKPGKVVRRVKTDEEKMERARRTEKEGRDKEKASREQEIEFEVRSASGVSSDGSPKEGERREDEKWMDILIANGARRMERQDAPPPAVQINRGLPTTPRPPSRSPGPQPHPQPLPPLPAQPQTERLCSRQPDERLATRYQAAQHPYHTHDPSGGAIPDPYASLDDNYRYTHHHSPSPPGTPTEETDHTAHTTETTGTGETSGTEQPRRSYELHRKPVPPIPDQRGVEPDHDYDHDHDRNQTARLAYNCSDGSQGVARTSYEGYAGPALGPEIVSPAPQRRIRDTIHNIVDTYRDSAVAEEEVHGVGTGVGGDEEDGAGSGKRRSAGSTLAESGENGADLAPPGMVFDVTPGREPSPARYQHGVPLEFGEWY